MRRCNQLEARQEKQHVVNNLIYCITKEDKTHIKSLYKHNTMAQTTFPSSLGREWLSSQCDGITRHEDAIQQLKRHIRRERSTHSRSYHKQLLPNCEMVLILYPRVIADEVEDLPERMLEREETQLRRTLWLDGGDIYTEVDTIGFRYGFITESRSLVRGGESHRIVLSIGARRRGTSHGGGGGNSASGGSGGNGRRRNSRGRRRCGVIRRRRCW